MNLTDLESNPEGSVEDFLLTLLKEFGITRDVFPRNSPRKNFGKPSDEKFHGLISR